MSFADILDQLGAVSPFLPLLARVILVALLAVLAWTVVSIPAYWLSRVLDDLVRRTNAALLSALRHLFSTARRLREGCSRPLENFLCDHAGLDERIQAWSQILISSGATVWDASDAYTNAGTLSERLR